MWAWTPGPQELLWEEGSALRGPREGNCQAAAAGSHRTGRGARGILWVIIGQGVKGARGAEPGGVADTL